MTDALPQLESIYRPIYSLQAGYDQPRDRQQIFRHNSSQSIVYLAQRGAGTVLLTD